MTPDEREQLRRDLEAAGCPALVNAVNEWPHLMTAELPELRSLLRREEPEPVTEEGLRAEGFRRHDTPFGDNWVLRVQDDLDITFFQRRWVLAEFEGGEYELHIESMQELRTVITALRGKP